MWVLVRLLVAVLVGLARFFWRQKVRGEVRVTGTVRWQLRQGRHKGRIIQTQFGVAYENPAYLRFSRESATDRFFKGIGFTQEIQTGDPAFDSTIYVAGDHPAIAPVLQVDSAARGAILAEFQAGAQQIAADGQTLWVYRRGDAIPDEAAVARLAQVRDALQAVPVEHLAMLRDRFFWRALFVEALAWSLAFYGLPAIAEIAVRPHPLYFDLTPVIMTGLAVAVGLFAALFMLSRWLLRGSSRSHRVLTESAILLLIGVPLSSIQMVSDLNVSLDQSTPVQIERAVTDRYTRVTRSKSGSRTHYHVRLAPAGPGEVSLPAAIEVTSGVYSRVGQNGRIAVRMHAGAIGIPWVENIRAVR